MGVWRPTYTTVSLSARKRANLVLNQRTEVYGRPTEQPGRVEWQHLAGRVSVHQ